MIAINNIYKMNIKKIICSLINFDNLRFYDTCFRMKIHVESWSDGQVHYCAV